MKKQVKELQQINNEGMEPPFEPDYKKQKSIVTITRTEKGDVFVSAGVQPTTAPEEIAKIHRIGNYIRTLQKAGYQFEIVDYKIPV